MLCYHAREIPSILVLNKLDLKVDSSKDFYRLAGKLTCGYLGGVKQLSHRAVDEKKPSKVTLDSYLKRKAKVHELRTFILLKKDSCF